MKHCSITTWLSSVTSQIVFSAQWSVCVCVHCEGLISSTCKEPYLPWLDWFYCSTTWVLHCSQLRRHRSRYQWQDTILMVWVFWSSENDELRCRSVRLSLSMWSRIRMRNLCVPMILWLCATSTGLHYRLDNTALSLVDVSGHWTLIGQHRQVSVRPDGGDQSRWVARHCFH